MAMALGIWDITRKGLRRGIGVSLFDVQFGKGRPVLLVDVQFGKSTTASCGSVKKNVPVFLTSGSQTSGD